VEGIGFLLARRRSAVENGGSGRGTPSESAMSFSSLLLAVCVCLPAEAGLGGSFARLPPPLWGGGTISLVLVVPAFEIAAGQVKFCAPTAYIEKGTQRVIVEGDKVTASWIATVNDRLKRQKYTFHFVGGKCELMVIDAPASGE